MSTPAPQLPSGAFAPPGAILRLLAACLDIESLWSLDHEPDERPAGAARRLLAFADARTLARLRASEHLHVPEVEFLVVIDGDAFASAWGPSRVSGSLARWAWRQSSAGEAFYDESRWSVDAGHVVRVRRKAFLTWPAPLGV